MLASAFESADLEYCICCRDFRVENIIAGQDAGKQTVASSNYLLASG